MSENSLTIFSRGSQMLAEANTIQKARDLKDLALTAADWARRVGAGEAAIQYAKSYAFEAEHRMGEMLAETERAKPGPSPKIGAQATPISQPTLSDIGISKHESARAQKIAALPEDTFEQLKKGETTIKKALDETKEGREKKHQVNYKGSFDDSSKMLDVIGHVSILLDSISDCRPVKKWSIKTISSMMEIQKKIEKIINNLNTGE
jgi:hypothetical protein